MSAAITDRMAKRQPDILELAHKVLENPVSMSFSEWAIAAHRLAQEIISLQSAAHGLLAALELAAIRLEEGCDPVDRQKILDAIAKAKG